MERHSGNRYWKKGPAHKNKGSGRGRGAKQQIAADDPLQEGYLTPKNVLTSHGGGARHAHGGGARHAHGGGARHPARHPAHLKGREIGMFYAKKAQEKRKAGGVNKMENTPILKLEDFEAIDIQEQLKDCASSLSNTSTGEDWKTKYSYVNDSRFKQKFLDNLKGNDSTHFASGIEGEKSSLPLQNSAMDCELKEDLKNKSSIKDYQEMCETRSKLPISSRCEEILKCVEENQVVVICGETGCGKSTQVGLVQYPIYFTVFLIDFVLIIFDLSGWSIST